METKPKTHLPKKLALMVANGTGLWITLAHVWIVAVSSDESLERQHFSPRSARPEPSLRAVAG